MTSNAFLLWLQIIASCIIPFYFVENAHGVALNWTSWWIIFCYSSTGIIACVGGKFWRAIINSDVSTSSTLMTWKTSCRISRTEWMTCCDAEAELGRSVGRSVGSVKLRGFLLLLCYCLRDRKHVAAGGWLRTAVVSTTVPITLPTLRGGRWVKHRTCYDDRHDMNHLRQ